MVFGQCLRVRALIWDFLKMALFYILFTPTIQLTMITLHVLAVAVGVPEEPKEGTAETSSKFSGSTYPIIHTI